MAQPSRRIGQYELLAELGRGGFATVYKARDTRLGREVALKVIHGNFAQEQSFIERFKAEVQTAARLRHPNIVAVYDYDDADGELYLAMELITGASLRAYLDHHKRLTLDQALPILRQVAEALDYLAEQHLVHRDIKPANILLEGDVDRLQVKLADFGLVRSLGSSVRLTQTLSVIGTPTYMAPEQSDAKKWGDITFATDVYALGVVTYEMLCGRPPFDGETLTVLHAHAYDQPPSPLEFTPELGVDLEAVLLRGLDKAPSARYASAGALVAAVQQVQIVRQQQARQQSELAQLIEQAQAARQARNWPEVHRLCVQIMQIDRAYPDLTAWLTEATTEFQRESAEEVTRRQRAKRYEEGEAALNAGQWQTAISAFEEVAQGNPDFREVQQKLAQARDEYQLAQWYDEAIAQGEAHEWATACITWLRILRGRGELSDTKIVSRFTEVVQRLLEQWFDLNEENKRVREALFLYDALTIAMSKQELTEANEMIENLLTLVPDLKQPLNWLRAIRPLAEQIEIGKIYTGKVVRTVASEAYVEIMPGIDGVVHISQLADYRAPTVKSVVKVGDEVMVMAIEIDAQGNLRLSRRAVLEGLTVGEVMMMKEYRLQDDDYDWDAVAEHTKSSAIRFSFPESIAKPLSADRLRWLIDGKEMVSVPAGEFLYGDKRERINLPEFWIDKTPVTNAEFERFVKAAKYKTTAEQKGSGYIWNGKEWEWERTVGADWRHPHGPSTSIRGIMDHPVVQVSWEDAIAYAKWAGKHLPTEQEWEKAARGINGRKYPWGNQQPDAKLCNFDQSHEGTTPVSKYSPQGDSPYGCVDMVGNVWEWTANDYDNTHKVVRGSSWVTFEEEIRATIRDYSPPLARDDSLGFRCSILNSE